MKKAMMEKWVKALESGKFKQTKEKLCKRGRYCCLGVACEINGAGKLKFPSGAVTFDGSDSFLPISVKEKLGMRTHEGNFIGVNLIRPDFLDKPRYRICDSLADLNDNGLNFKDIAKFIRLNYKVL